MKIAHEKFHVNTSLSENQAEKLLIEGIASRSLSYWDRISEGFAGQLYTDKKEFNSAFFYRSVKCVVVTGYYAADGERTTSIHFDIRWPVAEVLSIILGALGSAIVPFIFSKYYFVLPMLILIGWPLIGIAFCAGLIGYYYVPGIKLAKTKLTELFAPNVQSVVED